MQDRKAQHDAALAQQRFELDRQTALLQHELALRDQQFQHAHQAIAAAAGGSGADGAAGGGGAANLAPLVAHLTGLMQQMNAPKRVVRDAQGRVAGVEPVPMPMSMPMQMSATPLVGTPPPVPGARLAPDGHHYVADPNRPGKYLKVGANG
jgi:hypothetical protein